jgi:sterol desaturase/sphingolipid hydroxylase (fatty acid hydroxylase superfamily)
MIAIIFYFLLWTLVLYVLHRIIHVTPVLKNAHWDHHKYINLHETSWHWSNLFLFNDTWISTLDLWISEVVPTLIFAWLTGQWWIAVFYYVWAAFFQESLEHNKQINWYPFTSGQWHLTHHRQMNKNYGLFIPLWDRLFSTEKL